MSSDFYQDTTQRRDGTGTSSGKLALSRKAAQELKAMTIDERVSFLKRLSEVILREEDFILDEIQKCAGKSRSDAYISEIFSVLDFIHYAIKNAKKELSDQSVPTPLALMGKKSKILVEPKGVVLVISPWNYPFFQGMVPAVLSFVAGNATVIKPSEFTPMQGLWEKIFSGAGFREEWIRVAYGDGSVGAELIAEGPDMVFFTGSVRTGKKIMSACSEHLIPVVLELGGKDPMIVFDDVDVERTASGAAWGVLTNTGQACTSVERLYVHRNIYDEFRKQLVRQFENVKQEVDRDGSSEIGRMTTPAQIDIVREHLENAESKGAKVTRFGSWDGKNDHIPPAIVENANSECKVLTDETFGPVVNLVPFDTEEEVVQMANDSSYGLASSVWSKDLVRAERVASALKTGNVSINNVMLTEGNPALPFGGVKDSGFGRYKGRVGFSSFSNLKSVLIDKDSKKIEVNWYPYTPKKLKLFRELTASLFKGGIGGLIGVALTGLKLEGYANKIGHSLKRE